MAHELRLGMIGLDTSHVTAFTDLLHNPERTDHVPGGRVVVAYPGGSSDFELSRIRVEGYTETLKNQHGVHIVNGCAEVAESCDAIFLESVDGRVHRAQFEEVVHYKKPVFVDKPFALCYEDAVAMARVAEKYQTPVFSCSALRYSEALIEALHSASSEEIIGFDAYGPMMIETTQPGLFWYGIHCVEALYAVYGRGCKRVTVLSNSDCDVVVGEWEDGRMGTIRGNRKGNNQFSALIHTKQRTLYVDISGSNKPFYASLLEQIMAMFSTRKSPLAIQDTLEIIRFIEAANQSRQSGLPVELLALREG